MHIAPFMAATDRDLWAVVLAGGEGVRMRSLVSRIYGDDRPKQYAALLDSRTLLRQTLDRVALGVPPRRTLVVTVQSQVHHAVRDCPRTGGPHLLSQPRDLGTAAGVLLPAHWIRARDAGAIVAVFPSDHFVLEEARFVAHVAAVADFVALHPEWIVVLGVESTYAEPEYGWIEPGERLGLAGGGSLHRISRFREKPSPAAAATLLSAGWLWNTLVTVASVATLIEAGRRCVPRLHDRLEAMAAFAGTDEEAWAIQQAYAFAPRASFSHAILQDCSLPLAVSILPSVTWCDLGTPARVARTLTGLGQPSPWGAMLGPTA